MTRNKDSRVGKHKAHSEVDEEESNGSDLLPIVDPRIPPRRIPAMDPMAAEPPKTLKALLRSGPAGYVVVTIACALGTVNPAPMP